jgi:heat-inducible transcriptional repressor
MNDLLTERMNNILQYVINEYIDTGEPVGSRTLVKKYNMKLSPATIRNIMADLEDAGYLFQPHTSAGRVPTKAALQYYVDSLIQVRDISDELRQKVMESVQGEELKLSSICSRVSDIISNITNCVSVVIVPDIRMSSLKHIEFLKLGEKRVLVIIVNELGQVQNKILEMDSNVSQYELNKLSMYLNDKFSNRSIFEVKKGILDELELIKNSFNRKISHLIDKFSSIEWTDSSIHKDIVIKGLKNFIKSDYFKEDMEGLKKLLAIFDEKNKVLDMIDKSIKTPGIQIFIGSRSQEFENLSVITSSYSKNGVILGSLGVIGPLRMKYDTIIPIVDCAAQIITTVLNDKFRRLS